MIAGNQFVWVPVNEEQYSKMIDETNMRGNLYDFSTTGTKLKTYSSTGYREPDSVTEYDTSINLSAAGINATDSATLKALLQEEFNEMAVSVKKYKGFYIGRYETGNLEAVKNSTPVVQRGNTKIVNVDWYHMYANIKNIAKNNNKVTSTMIWGCQWDRTLEWIVASNGNNWSLVTDSTSWGNYTGTTFEYTAEDGTTKTKTKSSKMILPTGSSERNKKNNIYDMAGNVIDRTLEAYSTYSRVGRGGDCDDTGSIIAVSGRSGYSSTSAPRHRHWHAYSTLCKVALNTEVKTPERNNTVRSCIKF